MALEIGQLIDGKYRIVRLIGEGGMGAVFEGENVRIGRRVAIKVLHAALTGNKEVVQRFEREAQAAGRIGSDHILEVIDLGELPDGDHFMVMEYLDGEPLSLRIERRGRMTPVELGPLAKQLLRGLSAAHRAGIVHRDLKPDNVYILREKANQADFVKIIDFGISKFQPLSGEGMKMTRTGTVMGTPYYMSPEQASGSKEADNRSDLYSVGVILYEAVTGRVPFEATTFNQLMFKIVLAEIPAPQTLVPELDPAFASIILKAMARDVNYRFQTADEFVAAMDAWEAGGSRAVTVPPTHAADLVPSAAGTHAQQAASAGLEGAPGTGSNFATSQAAIPGKKSLAPLAVALGVIGLLILGGGGALAYMLFGGKSSSDPLVAASASAPSPVVSRAPDVPKVVPAARAASSAGIANPEPDQISPPVASVPRVAGRGVAPLPATRERGGVGLLPGKSSIPAPPAKTDNKPAGKAKTSGAADFGY